jgi:hypothetical protein
LLDHLIEFGFNFGLEVGFDPVDFGEPDDGFNRLDLRNEVLYLPLFGAAFPWFK